jgi:uncharacterized damage-inducible protein DinB
MKEFFKELFEYSHHYNQELLKVILQRQGQVPEKSLKLLSHVINAHHIWNSRIDGKAQAFAVWEIQPTEKLRGIDEENYAVTRRILDQVDLSSITTYTNTKGQTFTNTVKDILFHVVNHSTHHRAQIASDFKQNGIEPLISDYIFYKRS